MSQSKGVAVRQEMHAEGAVGGESRPGGTHGHGHGDGDGDDHVHDHHGDLHAEGLAPLHGVAGTDAVAASRLPWVLALTIVFFVVEIVAAGYAHSNALRADAIHLLADVLAIAIAFAAFRLADRHPSARFTFGLRRIEAVAALINALLVFAGAAEIVREGVEILGNPAPPRTGIMLVVAAGALVVHGINATLLHGDLHAHGHRHGHDHASPHIHLAGVEEQGEGKPKRGGHLHLRGAWLHVLGDALGALFTLIAAAAIRAGAPAAVDPLASLGVAGLLVFGAVNLIRDATLVLMEAAPSHLPVEAIERAVNEVEGIVGVNRLRVWTLGTGYDAIALHVSADGSSNLDLAGQVERRLRAELHVDYVCVQVDPHDSSHDT